MKAIVWLGSTRKDIRACPWGVQHELGKNLCRIQFGEEPHDWKIMKGVGHGVKEIRIHAQNEYRLVYVDKFDAVYVLHIFVKKSEKTLRKEIMQIRARYELLLKTKGFL